MRELAIATARIFDAQGIQREALAALQLFREAATVGLAQRVMAEIEKARRSATPCG